MTTPPKSSCLSLATLCGHDSQRSGSRSSQPMPLSSLLIVITYQRNVNVASPAMNRIGMAGALAATSGTRLRKSSRLG